MAKVYIYGLIDPRNGKFFYVGRSKNIQKRIATHLNPKPGGGTSATNTIVELKKDGLLPDVSVLAGVDSVDAAISEADWIYRLSSDGHPLTNIVANIYSPDRMRKTTISREGMIEKARALGLISETDKNVNRISKYTLMNVLRKAGAIA